MSRISATVSAPIGTSVKAEWTGWPSHVPLKKSLTGRIGRNSADSQRLKSPNGRAQPAWASTRRVTRRPIIRAPPWRSIRRRPVGGSFGRLRSVAMSSQLAPPARWPGSVDRGTPGRDDWRVIVAVFWITSMVENLGVSQVFALLPAYLSEMGVAKAERLSFVGLFTALIFVVGAPLVPLWGVWADKYSRKAVIVRSASSRRSCSPASRCRRSRGARVEPAADRVPAREYRGDAGRDPGRGAGAAARVRHRRLRRGRADRVRGRAVAAGFLVDGLGWSLSAVFCSRPSCPSSRRCRRGSGRARSGQPSCRRVGCWRSLTGRCAASSATRPSAADLPDLLRDVLAYQLSRPYLPIIVEDVRRPGCWARLGDRARDGTAALVGAVAATGGGALGDRLGFRPVLLGAPSAVAPRSS